MGVVTRVLAAASVFLPGSQRMQTEADLLLAELRIVTAFFLSSRILAGIVLLIVAYVVYSFLVRPMFYIRRNADVGYITAPGQTATERANEVSDDEQGGRRGRRENVTEEVCTEAEMRVMRQRRKCVKRQRVLRQGGKT